MGSVSDSEEVFVRSEVFIVQLEMPIWESLFHSVKETGTVFDSSLIFHL